jgi:hypothetical protein
MKQTVPVLIDPIDMSKLFEDEPKTISWFAVRHTIDKRIQIYMQYV